LRHNTTLQYCCLRGVTPSDTRPNGWPWQTPTLFPGVCVQPSRHELRNSLPPRRSPGMHLTECLCGPSYFQQQTKVAKISISCSERPYWQRNGLLCLVRPSPSPGKLAFLCRIVNCRQLAFSEVPGPSANIDSSVLRTLPLGCCANRDVACPLLISSRSCSEHYRSRCTALALGWSATAPPLPSCPNSPVFWAGLSIDVFGVEFRSRSSPKKALLRRFELASRGGMS
jgi:hypothetical protein